MSWLFLIEGLLTILFFKGMIPLFRSRGIVQYVREEGPQLHNYKQGTPTAGGVLFLLVFLAFYVGFQFFSPSPLFVPVVLATLFFGGIGLLGDALSIRQKNSHGLSARSKFLLQLAASLVLFFVIQGHEVQSPIMLFSSSFELHLGWVYPLFFVLYLTGFSNATNLTDGLDGLSGGTALISALGAQLLMILLGVSDYSMLFLAGALLGFLWFNVKPASIFMGDAGALALGGVIGTVALCTRSAIFFVFLSLVFWIEVLSVVLQVSSFKIFHRKIFRMSPIHHHFELLGWRESQIVIRFWIANFLGVVLSLALVLV